MWTKFMDMHSGGGSKEPYDNIYIEAPRDEAKVIFYNRFGHNPDRITCTCCGEDYSMTESVSLKQATGYERGCASLKPKRGKDGRYINDDPVIEEMGYLDPSDKIPVGYEVSKFTWGTWISLDDYLKKADVLVIYAKDIKPNGRVGDVPEQGYVWQD